MSNDTVISKEPWPKYPISTYRDVNSGPWGYLYQFPGGRFLFDESCRPSDQEILERWGYYLREGFKER